MHVSSVILKAMPPVTIILISALDTHKSKQPQPPKQKKGERRARQDKHGGGVQTCYPREMMTKKGCCGRNKQTNTHKQVERVCVRACI